MTAVAKPCPDCGAATLDGRYHLLSQTDGCPEGIGAEDGDFDGTLLFNPEGDSFKDALTQVDPKDSEAALAMLDWLLQTGRLQRIGVLDGGMGYLFGYTEPKGSTKQGYTPGATKGDRIVDAAVEQARASGISPAKTGICRKCVSAIRQEESDDRPKLDDEDATNPFECMAGGGHVFID